MLGVGALKKITGGKSIGLPYTMAILKTVASELTRLNSEKIAKAYE